jgi:hypothetical protein
MDDERSSEKDHLLELHDALLAWFTSLVELPDCPDLEDGSVWWERDGGWLYPWRVRKVDGVMQGHPCGEPKKAHGT